MLLFVEREVLLPYAVWSLLAGILFGAVYDFFRIRRVAFNIVRESGVKHGKRFYRFIFENLSLIDFIVVFAEDIIFFLFCTVVLILVNFKLYFGFFRWYSLLSAIGGFFLYRCTVGRIVISFSRVIVRFIVSFVKFAVGYTIIPIVAFFKHILVLLKEKIEIKRKIRYTRLYEKNMLLSVCFEVKTDCLDKKTEVENNVKG